MLTVSPTGYPGEFRIEELAPGAAVTLDACVHKVRDMGGFAFVMLRTARYVLQAVWQPGVCREDLTGVKEGCYVTATGTVREEERAPRGREILLSSVTVLTSPKEEYPLRVSAKKLGCSIDANLKYRSVALRNPRERAVFKVAEGVCEGFRRFLLAEDFTEIHTPKIVSTGAEGGANIFSLKYFGREAYLAQSPQFYKQTMVAVFDRVFEIAPVYRAEKHNTTRHLNEYIGLDLEMGYIRDMYDVMRLETALMRYIVSYLREHYADEVEMLGATLPEVGEIPAVTFIEAAELTGGSTRKHDLDPGDEAALCEKIYRDTGSEFVFVTKFPSAKRPFYAMDSADDPRTAESFDLLFRGLEITTGGQRIHDYDRQVEKMERMGLSPSDFESYLQIFKYGMPPHGGLGIGLERLTMKLLGLANIREASLFPRDIGHLEP